MPPNTPFSYVLLPSNPSPLSERLPSRLPAVSEPAPRQRPGATNLRSSAVICGSCFEEAPPVQCRKRTRMTPIKRIFTDSLICANPRHPCNPCSMAASLLGKAPQINKSHTIKLIHQSLRTLRPLRCFLILLSQSFTKQYKSKTTISGLYNHAS